MLEQPFYSYPKSHNRETFLPHIYCGCLYNQELSKVIFAVSFEKKQPNFPFKIKHLQTPDIFSSNSLILKAFSYYYLQGITVHYIPPNGLYDFQSFLAFYWRHLLILFNPVNYPIHTRKHTPLMFRLGRRLRSMEQLLHCSHIHFINLPYSCHARGVFSCI